MASHMLAQGFTVALLKIDQGLSGAIFLRTRLKYTTG